MTIEFLRARLLSERSISKSAKQQSEQLAKKVMELEKNLLVEMEKRKLSQIAAEQALTKLESAGVHLDSTQLDIFVREHDSKKEAPVYQDKDSTADFSQPQQCMDSYLESQRSNDVESSYDPKINGQNKDLNEAEVDQNHLEPQSNPRALELDEVKDEERDSPCPLSETKALDSQALSSASQNQRVFPVRGIGRSCRTFKKKYTSLATDEPPVEYFSENAYQEELETSDLSGWVNHVVDMFEGNSRKIHSHSFGNSCTDLGQSDSVSFDCEKEQYHSKKDNCHSSTDPVKQQAIDKSRKYLYNESSTELQVEQKMETCFCQNTEKTEACEKVQKPLEQSSESNASNQSQENAEILWEQQHPLSTSEQGADQQRDSSIHNSKISSSFNLHIAPKPMLEEQEGRSELDLNFLQIQEQEIKNQESYSLSIQSSHSNHLSLSDQDDKSSQSNSDETFKVDEGIKEVQCGQESKAHILEENIKLNCSERGKVTHLLAAREEEGSMHLLYLASHNNARLMNTSVDAMNCEVKACSVHNPESEDPLMANEDKPLSSYMSAQVDADVTDTKSSAPVKCKADENSIIEGKGIIGQGHSTAEAIHNNGYSQKNYSSNLNYFSSHNRVVTMNGGIRKELLEGKLTRDNSGAGVPSGADLQRQALHGRHVQESFGNLKASNGFRITKMEENKRFFGKPSSYTTFHKDVQNTAQGFEHAAATNQKMQERTLLYQNQLHPQTPLSDPLFHGKESNISGLPYGSSMTQNQQLDHHMFRREVNAAPSMPISRHHNFGSYASNFPGRLESHTQTRDDRTQKVLMALRLAKEQIKISIDQRQPLCTAPYEMSHMSLGPRDYSSSGYNHPIGRNIGFIPALGSSMSRHNHELHQRGIHKEFKLSDFRGLHNGLQTYAPPFNPAFMADFKHHSITAGNGLIPPQLSLSREPGSSFMDKLNVGKGIDFFFGN